LTAHISGKGQYIKIENKFDRQRSLRGSAKIGELWSTNKKVMGADVDPP